MDERDYLFKKVYWEDVRDEVKAVDAPLADIIDRLDPDHRYPLIKCNYRFGDLIVKNGITQLPLTKDRLLPIIDSEFKDILKDQLTYTSIPLFLVLKNTCEVFIQSSTRVIPLNIFYPGGFLGVFETLDFIFNRQTTSAWCVSAGARSLFTLPKINEESGFKRLKAAYNLDSSIKPRHLWDHWNVFHAIARHKNFEQQWQNEILFFTKNWLLNHHKDKNWFIFKDYLFKNAWFQAQFAISKVGLNLTWEHFSDAIAARNLKPIPYLVDQVKHILLIAAGRWPGFKSADASDQVAPINGLQEALINTYMIKKYFPTMMHITSLEHEAFLPKYYSLSNPTLLEGAPFNRSSSSTIMIDLRDIKQLIDTLTPLFNKVEKGLFANIKFDFFHVEKDKYKEIQESKELKNSDKNLLDGLDQFLDREFCSTSQFWRGCVRIFSKEA